MDRTSEPNIPIASIAKIGLQIAAAIQTYVQAFDESDRSLADVAINIYNSASALEQLRKLIDEDESARTQQNPLYVLKDEGRTQIEALAAQCHRLYNAIIAFVSKARRPGQEVNLSVSHPETISFTASSISETLKWRWLDPRIERCQKLLKWLEINLAFVLQLALLARFQIRYPNREPGTFEEESALRQLAVKLRSQRLKHAKDRAREQRESREAASSLSTRRVSVSTTPTEILGNKNFDSKTEAVSNIIGPGATSSPIKTPSVSAPSVDNSDKETCVADPEERIHIIANSQDKVNSDKLLPSKSPSLVLKTKVQKRLHIFNPGSSDSYDWKGITPNTVENSLLTHFKRKLGAVTPLLQRIFWRGSRFTRDWESTELEAYIVHEKGMEIRKLFLGHKRLSDELNRALQRDGPTLLDRYTSLDSNLYMQINKAIFMAKCQDLRQRTIIAIHHYHGASNNLNGTVLFFSLGSSTEPIHLTDCIGRPYDIPYEHGGSWDLMHNTLTEAFNGVEDVAYRVRRGHYDILLAEGGLIVPRGAFGAIVKPGSKVFMKMWPPSTQMPRRIGPPMPSTAWGRPWHHPLPGRNTPLILRVKPLGYKDIENDIERMGIQINFEDEVDVAKRSLGDTLTKLTNATDHVGEFYCKAYDSDSDGDSVSSGSLVDGED